MSKSVDYKFDVDIERAFADSDDIVNQHAGTGPAQEDKDQQVREVIQDEIQKEPQQVKRMSKRSRIKVVGIALGVVAVATIAVAAFVTSSNKMNDDIFAQPANKAVAGSVPPSNTAPVSVQAASDGASVAVNGKGGIEVTTVTIDNAADAHANEENGRQAANVLAEQAGTSAKVSVDGHDVKVAAQQNQGKEGIDASVSSDGQAVTLATGAAGNPSAKADGGKSSLSVAVQTKPAQPDQAVVNQSATSAAVQTKPAQTGRVVVNQSAALNETKKLEASLVDAMRKIEALTKEVDMYKKQAADAAKQPPKSTSTPIAQKSAPKQVATKTANGVKLLQDGLVVSSGDGNEAVYSVGDATPFGKVVSVDAGKKIFVTDKGSWIAAGN